MLGDSATRRCDCSRTRFVPAGEGVICGEGTLPGGTPAPLSRRGTVSLFACGDRSFEDGLSCDAVPERTGGADARGVEKPSAICGESSWPDTAPGTLKTCCERPAAVWPSAQTPSLPPNVAPSVCCG